jgi:hypothetical protein
MNAPPFKAMVDKGRDVTPEPSQQRNKIPDDTPFSRGPGSNTVFDSMHARKHYASYLQKDIKDQR